MHFLNSKASVRTILILIIFVPTIAYLLRFAYKKNKESGPRSAQCRDECTAEGYPGYDFEWSVFSQPSCACLGEPEFSSLELPVVE